MIAVAASPTYSVALDRLPFGWFDVVLLAVVGLGIHRGRKHGMTREVLPVFQWVAIVIVSGLGYQMAGQFFLNVAKPGILWASIGGYLSLTLLVLLLFKILKKLILPHLEGSSFFGGMEYYLGSVSGGIRHLCLLFFVLALLHAPSYTLAEVNAQIAYNARWYGGNQQGFKGNFFPSVHTVQESVFRRSFAGPLIESYLGMILIHTPEATGVKPPPSAAQIHIGN